MAGEKEFTPDQIWDQAQKDRAATEAAPAQTAEAPAGEHKPATEQAQTKEPDPYDGLSGPVRKLLQGLDEKVKSHDAETARLRQQLATAHGTIGNLKQRFDSEIGKLKPTVDAVEAQKKADAEKAAAEAEAKRKARRERMTDLPDVLEEIEEMEHRLADAKPAKEQKPEEKPATETVTELPADREARLIAERELSDLHPKWIETVRSAEFKKWRDAQPAAIQALGASDDIADAAKMLDAYKQHQKDAAEVARVDAERQARLSRGETVTGRGSSQADGGQDGDLWELAKRDREKARAEARA